MLPRYALLFINVSSNAGSLCLFQQDPGLGVSGASPIVWAALAASQGGWASIDWEERWSAVWTTASVGGDRVLAAGEAYAVDLEAGQAFTLSAEGEGLRLTPTRESPGSGQISILEAADVPLRAARVGVGIGGQPTSLVDAQPNLSLRFSPSSSWRLFFGDCHVGDVVDSTQIDSSWPLEFPPNIYQMTATIEADNTLTLEPGWEELPVRGER